MNKANDNSFIKVLTDIQIKQSRYWCDRADYLGDLNSKNKLIDKIPLNIRKKLRPFFELIKILRHRHRYDVVINANIKTGQLFALFRSIFYIKRPKHIILELMLDEEQNNLRWKIKKMIQKVILSSVDLVFVSSVGEIATYSKRFKIPKDRLRFLPFHTNVMEPRMINHSDGYILSAGKTGRDYVTLADAVRGLKEKVIIVSDKLSVRDIKFPLNVEVLFDIPYPSYLDLLHNCAFVVVPLKKLVKSTGQVAILEAMAVGKPVVATETTGTVDYIQSGINGISVPVGDPKALRNAIEKLTNDLDLYKKVATNALESVKQNHTFDEYVKKILAAANSLAKGDSLA
jgi:glycosyltransferase involved in cell wall biosynthesis